MNWKAIAALAVALAMGEAVVAKDQELVRGLIVHVDDGDTVVMLVDQNQVKVRLGSIDAPERSHTNKEKGRVGQPFSNNATRALAEMVKGRQVDARCFSVDRYGRSICDLFADGLWVNAELVRQGMAWPYTGAGGRYLRHRELLNIAERAREQGVGLWALPNPVEPWMWRKRCWEEGDCPQ